MRPQVQTDGESLTAHTIWSETVLCIISSATISMLAFSQGINHPLRFLRHGLETIHDNLLGLHLQHLATTTQAHRGPEIRRLVFGLCSSFYSKNTYVPSFHTGTLLTYAYRIWAALFQWRAPALLLLLRAVFDSLLQAGTLRFIMDESGTSMDVAVVSESHVCCKGSTATVGMRKKMVIENQMRRTGCV